MFEYETINTDAHLYLNICNKNILCYIKIFLSWSRLKRKKARKQEPLPEVTEKDEDKETKKEEVATADGEHSRLLSGSDKENKRRLGTDTAENTESDYEPSSKKGRPTQGRSVVIIWPNPRTLVLG